MLQFDHESVKRLWHFDGNSFNWKNAVEILSKRSEIRHAVQ